MKISQITESTTSGSVASVATPIGSTQKRAGTLFKGKKTKKKFYEAPEFTTKQQVIDYFVKRGKTAAQGASAWERGYRGPKPTAKAPEHWLDRSEREEQNKVNEEELQEQDVIIVPGMRRMKDKSFIPHKADRRDHEVEMARSDLYAAAKDAMRIFKLLKNRSEDKGIMGWQQSYITLAADYLNSVADSIEYDAQMNEITGGVLAGGIANVEEAEYKSGSGSKFVPSSTLKALDDWLLLSTKRDTAIYFGQTKKAVAIMKKIDELEDKIMTMKYGPEELALIKKELQKKNHISAGSNLTGNSVAEGQQKPFKVVYYDPKPDRNVTKTIKAHNESDIWDQLKAKGIDVVSVKEQGVAEGAPELLKQEMPLVRHIEKELEKYGYMKGTAEYDEKFKHAIAFYRKFGNIDAIKQGVAEGKCPKCGGPAFSEESIAEAKDACYHKVKSRYKVWPSAYASGALVKCRKVGASNWGNKSKK